MNESVGFVGLGIMGRGMARNLLRAGCALTVWNRTASRMDPLVAASAVAASSCAELATKSTVIFLCVSDTLDVEQVLFSDEGVATGVQPGALVIDCSTISPAATRDMSDRLAALGVEMLDAPISGGSEGAARGTLSIMVGGKASQFERALPYLRAVGQTVTHVGGHGAGQSVKLVNQILVVGTMLAVSEALIFAEAGGLDVAKALAAVEQGAAGSWMLSNRGTQAAKRDWRPGFTIDLQQKDLRLVLEAADQFGVPLPSTHLCFQLYRTLQARNLGHEGNHALLKALEHLSGITVGSRASSDP